MKPTHNDTSVTEVSSKSVKRTQQVYIKFVCGWLYVYHTGQVVGVLWSSTLISPELIFKKVYYASPKVTEKNICNSNEADSYSRYIWFKSRFLWFSSVCPVPWSRPLFLLPHYIPVDSTKSLILHYAIQFMQLVQHHWTPSAPILSTISHNLHEYPSVWFLHITSNNIILWLSRYFLMELHAALEVHLLL